LASLDQFIEIKEYLMKENQDVIAKLELLKLKDHKKNSLFCIYCVKFFLMDYA
jgi:hypothetical protein